MLLFFLCASGVIWGDVSLTQGTNRFHDSFTVNKGTGYSLEAGTYYELGTTVDESTSLKGEGKGNTTIQINGCGTDKFIFNVTAGEFAVDQITFFYTGSCAHAVAVVSATIRLSNVDIKQTSVTPFSSSILNIAGHGIFTKFTVTGLHLISTASTLIAGSPLGLEFDEAELSNLNFHLSTNTPCLINSDGNPGTAKNYFFNNTLIDNVGPLGNRNLAAVGEMFHFNSANQNSVFTFERSNITNIVFEGNYNVRKGVFVVTGGGGILNVTRTKFLHFSGNNYRSSVIYSDVSSHFSRCEFDDIRNVSQGTLYLAGGTSLSVATCIFNNIISNSQSAGIYSIGSSATIIETNFTELTSSGENVGIYLKAGNTQGSLTLSTVRFYNLTGDTYICVSTTHPLIATNVQFLDSQSRTSQTTGNIAVAYYAGGISTLSNCTLQNLKAYGYSGTMLFHGTTIWRSCLFQHLSARVNGGMCCQYADIVADNCTFDDLSGADGGAVHWHRGSLTLVRCIISKCKSSTTGGFSTQTTCTTDCNSGNGSKIPIVNIVNCEFLDNSAPTGGKDITMNNGGLPAINFTGSCSDSKPTQVTGFAGTIVPCTRSRVYVNTSAIRGGSDSITCGSSEFPCLTLNWTTNERYTLDKTLLTGLIQLEIIIDYGVYEEGNVVEVAGRPIFVWGTDGNEISNEAGVDITKTILKISASVDALFRITTGTLTCHHINFVQSYGNEGVMILVIGNAGNYSTMTLYNCTFTQEESTPISFSAIQISNSLAVCIINTCSFSNLIVKDKSAINIETATSVEFLTCTFTNINSIKENEGVVDAGGAIYSAAKTLSASNCVFTSCVTARNGGAIFLLGGFSFTDCKFDRCEAEHAGGALYIETPRGVNYRWMVRCNFYTNVGHDSDNAGNDIRDEFGYVDSTTSWDNSNAVECCSTSNFRKFSVDNANTGQSIGNIYESYLPFCYCEMRKPLTEDNWPCRVNLDDSLECYANAGRNPSDVIETDCSLECSNPAQYFANFTSGRCELLPCADRKVNTSKSASEPCGSTECWWDQGHATLKDKCTLTCSNDNVYEKENSTWTCVVKPCDERTASSRENLTEPCGPESEEGKCYADTGRDDTACNTECTNSSDKKYIPNEAINTCESICEKQIPNGGLTYPCTSDCYFDVGGTDGCTDECSNNFYEPDDNRVCVPKECKSRNKEGEIIPCGPEDKDNNICYADTGKSNTACSTACTNTTTEKYIPGANNVCVQTCESRISTGNSTDPCTPECYLDVGGTNTCADECSNPFYTTDVINHVCVLKGCESRSKDGEAVTKPCGPEDKDNNTCYADTGKSNTACSTACTNTTTEKYIPDANNVCVQTCESRKPDKNNETNPCGEDECYWDKGAEGDKCSKTCTNFFHYNADKRIYTCVLKTCKDRTPNSTIDNHPCGLLNDCCVANSNGQACVEVISCQWTGNNGTGNNGTGNNTGNGTGNNTGNDTENGSGNGTGDGGKGVLVPNGCDDFEFYYPHQDSGRCQLKECKDRYPSSMEIWPCEPTSGPKQCYFNEEGDECVLKCLNDYNQDEGKCVKDPVSKGPKGNNSWWWIILLIAAIVLVLLGAFLLFILLYKHKKKEEEEDESMAVFLPDGVETKDAELCPFPGAESADMEVATPEATLPDISVHEEEKNIELEAEFELVLTPTPRPKKTKKTRTKKRAGLNVTSMQEKTVDNFTADFSVSDSSFQSDYPSFGGDGLDNAFGICLENIGMDVPMDEGGIVGQAMFRLNDNGETEFLDQEIDGVED